MKSCWLVLLFPSPSHGLGHFFSFLFRKRILLGLVSGVASLIRETLQLFLKNCFLCGWAGRSHCIRRPIWLALLTDSHTDRNPFLHAGPNLKEWLREQFCDHPLEHCEDTRLHDAAYVGDLQTLRNLLQEESYRR